MPTHGEITYRDGAFRIDADPDARLRIKRIMPSIRTESRTLIVSATDDVCADLEMICQRWPMRMDDIVQARVATGAERTRQRAADVESILSGEVVTSPDVLEPIRTPRPYQVQAHALAVRTGRLLLADEMGLGKTLSALLTLGDPSMRPMLVVTLTGLPRQWIRELAKTYPDLTAHEIRGTKPYELAEDGRFPDLIVMNYAKLAGWAAHLDGKVASVCFDEIQELRRPDSHKHRAAALVADKAKVVWGLSGTPVMNFGGEMHSIMSVLDANLLGSRNEFIREWCPATYYDAKLRVADPEALRFFLTGAGAMLRRTRSDVGVDLPPVTIIEQSVEADPKAIREAESAASEIARLILGADTDRRVRWQASGELDWKLRQATGISKAPAVAAFVRLLLESEDRVILLGWHRAVIELWREELKAFGVALYTGTESDAAKRTSLDAFTSGTARVLIMSVRSGAGLDGLQDVCQNVVFGELDWSPGIHKQAIARLHRPGQASPVFAYFCVTDSGSDTVVLDALSLKAMEADLLVSPDVVGTVTDPEAGSSHVRALAEAILARAA